MKTNSKKVSVLKLPITRLAVFPTLSISLVLLASGCVMLVDKNPVGKLAKVSPPEAMRAIQVWPAETSGRIIYVPNMWDKSIWKRNHVDFEVGAHVTLEGVTERGLGYSIAHPIVDSARTSFPATSVMKTEYGYHMQGDSSGKIDFDAVHKIEFFSNPLGQGEISVTLYDANNQKMIKFWCDGEFGGAIFDKRSRATRALAAAFLSLCPNVH